WGPALDVTHDYETFLLQRDREQPGREGEPERERTPTPAYFRELVVADRSGSHRDTFGRGDDISIILRFQSDFPEQGVHAIVGVHRSADDLPCFAAGTHADGVRPLAGRGEYELTLQLRNVPLTRGEYSIIAYIGDENALSVFDRRDVRPGFSVTGDRFEVGLIGIDHRWIAEPVEAMAAER